MKFVDHCFLCLLKEKEVLPFLKTLEKESVQITIQSAPGILHLTFSSEEVVEPYLEQVAQKFPSYFFKDTTLQEMIQKEMVQRKKTLGLVESCTGGAIAARLVTVPGASNFFAGSIVAYSNEWKSHFLGLKRDRLLKNGAVNLETVREMVSALFSETNIDYAVAVSGLAGESQGEIYIAVGKRGEKIDAGRIMGPPDRLDAIELALQTALSALWRRLQHNVFTLS
jgi:PncC family amidohydrolase